MSTTTFLITLGVLFILSAFFSASEAALISINKIRLRHMIEQKRKGAKRIYGLVSNMDKLIATILVGNNLVNTAIATVTTAMMAQIFGFGEGIIYATVMITVALVIFGELIPKVIATTFPEKVAFFGRHFVAILIWLFTPITHILTWISRGFMKMFTGSSHHRSPLVTEEEIKMMIQIGKEHGYYGDHERKMLERIFHFDDTEVRDVMTPIEKVVAVPVDIHEDEFENILLEEGHNRIPVHSGEKANIIGILYVRDLLYLFRNGSLIKLSDLISAPYFVSPHMKVAELMREFQRRKIQIAIVQDPIQHSALGLVTLEDLIEEIVGEIEEKDSRLMS